MSEVTDDQMIAAAKALYEIEPTFPLVFMVGGDLAEDLGLEPGVMYRIEKRGGKPMRVECGGAQ